jgi:hypothetical protein
LHRRFNILTHIGTVERRLGKEAGNKCGENDHNEFDIVPLAKQGKLLTFTHLYSLPADY